MCSFDYLFAIINCKQTQETSCEEHEGRGTHQRSQEEDFLERGRRLKRQSEKN